MGYNKSKQVLHAPDAGLPNIVPGVGGGLHLGAVAQLAGFNSYAGSPVWVKTLSFTEGPNNSQVLIPHGITGMDALVKMEGGMKNSSGFFRPLPGAYNDSDVTVKFVITMNSVNLILESGTNGNWSLYAGHITIYYTVT